MSLDINKSVANIRRKNASTDGNWEVICEDRDCKEKTSSSKLHNWKTDRGFFCPTHKGDYA